MDSRLNSPPFARALLEMASGDAGGTSLRVSWPGEHRYERADDKSLAREFLPLPRCQQVYNRLLNRWEPNPSDQPIAMLGFAGRMLSVTSASRNAASAFQLSTWLGSGTTVADLSQRSHATLWFRKSQVLQAKAWLTDENDDDVTAASVTRVLLSGDGILLPRIPGIDEYLNAISMAVDQVLSGGARVEATLEQAAERCEAITVRYGLRKQVAAYRQHLGFDDSVE